MESGRLGVESCPCHVLAVTHTQVFHHPIPWFSHLYDEDVNTVFHTGLLKKKKMEEDNSRIVLGQSFGALGVTVILTHHLMLCSTNQLID